MAPIYTTLFVCEHLDDVPQESASSAQFLLLVCPSRPLEIGTNVHLFLVFDPPELVPFFPIATRAPFTALRLDIWGTIVGVQSRDRRRIEFEVENWNAEAPIQRAHIVVPWLPGLTAGRDLRGSPEAELPGLPDLPEKNNELPPAGPYAEDKRAAAQRPDDDDEYLKMQGLDGGYERDFVGSATEYAGEQACMYYAGSQRAARDAPRVPLPCCSDYWL